MPRRRCRELEEVTLAWLADLLGLPEGLHGHIEDTASTGLVTALAAARTASPGKRVVVCSEHTHSSTAKAARLLELELRAVPGDERYAMRLDEVDLDGRVRGRRDGRDDVVGRDRPGAGARGDVRRHRHLAPRRRRLRGERGGMPGAPAALRRLGARRLGRRQPAQVAADADGLLRVLHEPAEDLRNAFSLVPEYLRVSEDVVSLSEFGMPLGRRFRALKLWAVLRCHGREGLQAMIREHVRLGELFEEWVREEPGWEVCAPRHFSLVCFRREAPDEENEALLERVNATGEVFLSQRGSTAGTSCALRSATRDERGRRACRLGRPPARGGTAASTTPRGTPGALMSRYRETCDGRAPRLCRE